MTKIIGHRGAAGLALENSHDSIQAALSHNIAAIEFDIQCTKDGKLVIMHDRHTGRTAEEKMHVREATLAELAELRLKNGQRIPTLEEIFSSIGNKKPLVLDIKSTGCSQELLRLLAAYPKVQVSLTSFWHSELKKIHVARPDLPIFVLEHFSPFDIIHTARRLQATGISLNMWLMNPLTYRMAKRYGLQIRAYTINHPLLMHFFRKLYPDVDVYTDHPERFASE
jgi:glycerophosphoryl diester phosphodiesterase